MLAFVCQKYLLEHLKVNIVVSCLIENVDTLGMYLNEKSETFVYIEELGEMYESS